MAARRTALAPAVCVGVAVALQIAYPLTGGDVRDVLTAVIVLALTATCLLDAAVTRGAAVAGAVLLTTAVPGFAAEVVHRVVRLVLVNEFKRRQSAPGPRVTTRAFGRERRYPITSGWR